MPKLNVDLAPLEQYALKRRELLTELGCSTSCRDPLAEFSEWLVARTLGATAAQSRVQKGHDLVCVDGRRVQVKYLANASSRWINEHHIQFVENVEDYALVIYESFQVLAILVFRSDTIEQVCSVLGKRHPNQSCSLQFTRRNLQTILNNIAAFESLGLVVYQP